MFYRIFWEKGSEHHNGFLKAENKEDAEKIARKMINPIFEITEIIEAQDHQITPQSLTINFPNTTQYCYFPYGSF